MKTLTAVLICLALCGCTQNQKRATVTAKYPNDEVQVLQGVTDEFVVRKKDGSVWLVFCGNPISKSITSEAQLFPPNK